MKIAFIIYNGLTTLDFIGVYDPITRLKTMGFVSNWSWDICSYSIKVQDNTGLGLIATKIKESLQEYDMIIVPGAVVTRHLVDDTEFISWLQTAKSCKYKVSVCTGSLLLGAAGFLSSKIATTHPNAFAELAKYCASVVDKRIVDEGDVITARGVTSSIDLGLYLCEKFCGYDVKEQIRQRMDYLNNNY